jgi:hypothetical protein
MVPFEEQQIWAKKYREAAARSNFKLVFLTLGPRFAVSNPVESNGFLRAIKIRSTPSFGGKVEPKTVCHKILRHVKDSLASKNTNTSQG